MFKMAALELDHRAVPLEPFPAITLKASAKQNLRQNPRKKALRHKGFLLFLAPFGLERWLFPNLKRS
jgi:F420-0:gamma-glutamyl ligase-like protein